METKYRIGEKVFIVNTECQFCTQSFDHCDFGCSRYGCTILKEYEIKKIVIEDKTIYYCEDKDRNTYKFDENDDSVFSTSLLAKNYLAKVLSDTVEKQK